MKHLHCIFINVPWIDQSWLSVAWSKLNHAPVVHIARIASYQVMAYVAKYAAKTSNSFKKCVTFSKGWPKPEYKETLFEIDTFSNPPCLVNGRYELPTGEIIECIKPGCECFSSLFRQPASGISEEGPPLSYEDR